MITLRPYQQKLFDEIHREWNAGKRNVLAVLPTGGGKTVVFSEVIRSHRGAACAIAHRQELVSQISLALARDGVMHRIIGPKAVVKLCAKAHTEELGRAFVDPTSRVAVAGVDTLTSRKDALGSWASQVTLCVQDEAHHIQTDNKWGSAAELFPNARILGVTATPVRADGSGLGRGHGGLFDSMVVGPDMSWLISGGYLTPYRIFAPSSDIDLSSVGISSTTGDYSQPGLRTAVRRSHIIGDIVDHYRRIAFGKLGVTFATDVEMATEIAKKFEASGIRASVLSGKSSHEERSSALRAFRRREILQLVNCDLFGEGFDLPAIEVVSMARPTQSYGLYVQQFGRGLRLLEGKTHAIIIDHVGNVLRHGLPDTPRGWSLEARERRGGSSPVTTIKACPNCTMVYERFRRECPYCGHFPEPIRRDGPEFVDGDLHELTPDALDALRARVTESNKSPEEYRFELIRKHAPLIGQLACVKRHSDLLELRSELQHEIAMYGGRLAAIGMSDSERHRMFYINNGVDVLTAQTLKKEDTEVLINKLRGEK